MLDYIKSTIEILMTIKLEETAPLKSSHSEMTNQSVKSQDLPLEKSQNIETLLQKSEGEVRHHIGVIKNHLINLENH